MLGALALAGGVTGCGSLSSNHVDCNVVRLQKQAGRTDAEIASAIGESVAGVASCNAPGPSGSADSGPAPWATPEAGGAASGTAPAGGAETGSAAGDSGSGAKPW